MQQIVFFFFFSFLEAYFCLSPGLSWPPQTKRICSHWTISQCGIAEQLSTQLDSFYTTCPDRRQEVEDILLLSKKKTHMGTRNTLGAVLFLNNVQRVELKKIFQWQAHFSILLQQLRSVYFVVNLCSDFIQRKFGKFCLSLFFTWVHILGVLLLWRVISSSQSNNVNSHVCLSSHHTNT